MDAASAHLNHAIYQQFEKETQREEAMTVLAMCKSAEVSRAGFYRQRTARPVEDNTDLDLLDLGA